MVRDNRNNGRWSPMSPWQAGTNVGHLPPGAGFGGVDMALRCDGHEQSVLACNSHRECAIDALLAICGCLGQSVGPLPEVTASSTSGNERSGCNVHARSTESRWLQALCDHLSRGARCY